MHKFDPHQDLSTLLPWYRRNRRELPWRKTRNPYAIWISETMLQQTTTAAVIPYFERFMARYPSLKDLAAARDEDVLELWAGLGYYSRAKNLLRAARELAKLKEFPKRYETLLDYPGFGPYTARAVSSIAFDEPAGVIDGNVIRVLSRRFDLDWLWWQTAPRRELQALADQLASAGQSSEVNQALMELGAQICTPKNPHCVQCPWLTTCSARRKKTIESRPVARPRRAREIWVWDANLQLRQQKIRLTKNSALPFLSSHWVLPGSAKKQTAAPKNFSFKHSVTHHDIFVRLNTSAKSIEKTAVKTDASRWIALDDIAKHAPSSLIRKAMAFARTAKPRAVVSTFVATLFAVVVGASLISCRGTAPVAVKDKQVVAPTELSGGLRQLTSTGENYRPRFSPDGRHLLFLSEKRPSHPQPQVYELDLVAHTERRITFQDGTIYDAAYGGNGDTILYSSNTDEIKENPIYIRQALEKYHAPTKSNNGNNGFVKSVFSGDLPQTDVYSGTRDGRDIKRLTNEPGFDGEIAVRPKHNEAVAVFAHGGFLQLAHLSLGGGGMYALLNEKVDDEWPSFSSDGKKLAWMHVTSPSDTEIWLGDSRAGQGKKLIGGGAVYAWPTWSPANDELVFVSNKDTAKNLEIYLIKPDGSCVRRLTDSSDNKSEPTFSADGKTLYFTSDRAAGRQIYALTLASLGPAATACPSPAPSVQ